MVDNPSLGDLRARGRGASAARRSSRQRQAFGGGRGGAGANRAAGDVRCRLLPAEHAAQMNEGSRGRQFQLAVLPSITPHFRPFFESLRLLLCRTPIPSIFGRGPHGVSRVCR
jgi:hypothetical protein